MPSSSAKAGDPVFQSAGDGIEEPRRTGYPAFAGYDDYHGVTRCYETDDNSARRLEPFFGQQPHRGVGVHRLAEGKPLRVFAAQLIKLDRDRKSTRLNSSH